MKQHDVIKTFAGVNDGLWLDLVCVGPGRYNVEVPETDQIIAEGFVLPIHAEEWVVEMQARQRGWVRAT